MNDDDLHSDDYSDEEVEAVVMRALGELLNIAAGVAELQTTDEAAEDIYAICDLVAEYHGIERAQVTIEEHEDGSYTTRFEKPQPRQPRTGPIPGSIRTRNRPKFRLSDQNKPRDLE
jgi:hypothetical protein